MKNVITMLIVLALLAGGAIYERNFIHKEFSQFSHSLTCLYQKVEDGSATEDDVYSVQQNWLDKKATYAKKTQYPLQNLTYAKMMSMVFEDYAVAWNAYGIELKNDNVLIKHGKVIPMETLRQFSKLWLAENQMFDKYKNNIDFAIRKWWLVA